jgi:hypothetical protein
LSSTSSGANDHHIAPAPESLSEIGDAGGRIVRIAVTVVAAMSVQLLLTSSLTATAVIALVLSAWVAGRLVGRGGAITAAVFACYVLGDHHLADRHGVLGTGSVATTFLFVQASAVVAAELGARWRRRAELDATLHRLTSDARPPTPGPAPGAA